MDACTLCSMMLILYICSVHESGYDLYSSIMCVSVFRSRLMMGNRMMTV